ncbi:MAG: hypothetical protein AB7E72_12190 [Lysobacterales bacterium]
MPSSSAYAAPLELDLSPGIWERGALGVAMVVAASGILLTSLSGLPMAGLLLFAAAWAVHGWRQSAVRPSRLLLYADGQVEAALAGDLRAAELLQACSYLGLPQLQLRDGNGRQHSCTLFPDRLDGAGRHRLRVWLATHRPEDSAIATGPRRGPVSASARAVATQGRSYTGAGA